MLPALLLPALLAAGPNLLVNAQVKKADGITRVEILKDGWATWEGDNWDTPDTALIGKGAVLELDLGEVVPIGAARLQADNNDDFVLWGSEDGNTFSVLWRAPPDPLAGMRTRVTKKLQGRARYLRLTADGGDGLYSVGELQVFAAPDDLTDDSIKKKPRPPPPPRPPPVLDRSWFVLLALVILLALFFTRQLPRDAAAAAAQAKKDEPAAAKADADAPADAAKKDAAAPADAAKKDAAAPAETAKTDADAPPTDPAAPAGAAKKDEPQPPAK